MKLEITFIRHGLTLANEEKRYQGKTDAELSVNGIEALKQKDYTALQEVQKIFSSPMLRCIQTAEIIFGEAEKVIIPEWSEIDFGDFEGKNYQELSSDNRYQAWIDSGGRIAFPSGESREEFIFRTMQGYKSVLDYCRKRNITKAAACVHGGTIMAILSSVKGGDYFDYSVKNAECYMMVVDI